MREAISQKILQLRAEGNHKDAIQLLQNELIKSEDSYEACFFARDLGKLFEEAGDVVKAEHYYALAGEGFVREGEIFQAIAADCHLRKISNASDRSADLRRMIGETFGAARRRRKEGDAGIPVPTPFEEFSASIILEDKGDIQGRRNQIDPSESVRFALISSFRPAEVEAFISAMSLRELKAGEILYRQGDPATGFFVVVSGLLGMSSKAGFRMNLSPGEFFGDLSYLSRQKRGGTVSAQAPAECLEISGQAMENALSQFPNLKEKIWKFYERRLFLNMAGRSEVFRGLLPEELLVCFDQFLPADVPSERVIVKDGQKCESFYLLVQGHCSAKKASGEIEILAEGRFINIENFFLKKPSEVEVTTKTPVYLLEFQRDLFENLMDLFPRLKRNVEQLTSGQAVVPFVSTTLID